MTKSIRVDLEPDFPGQWIDVADIAKRSPNQFRKTQELSGSETEEGARAFMADVIAGWHVLNPETGAALPQPSSTDLDIGDVPIGVSHRWTEHIRQQFEALLPKAKG